MVTAQGRAGYHCNGQGSISRDKNCAGWITPAVIDLLDLDVEDYSQQPVFQLITAFRTGPMDGPALETLQDHAVSYGIRRCEFDDYLLRRSDARLRLGEPLEKLVHTTDGWLDKTAIPFRSTRCPRLACMAANKH